MNARLPAARRLRLEPLTCDSARLQKLESMLEVERRYATTESEARVQAEEAQAVAEERLLQGEAGLEAALPEAPATGFGGVQRRALSAGGGLVADAARRLLTRASASYSGG